MDLKAGGLLVPPTVKNSSCSHPRYTSHNFIAHIGIAETIEAVLILILTLGVIGANALVIFVINNRRYSPYIHQQPRYLLTSLALNDLTIGLLITPFGLLPALFHCWPYGEIFCQIQVYGTILSLQAAPNSLSAFFGVFFSMTALLRGALSQQSAVILVCMAVDRYMCALHPRKYYQHSSKKGCVAVLSLTWIISLTVFGFLVLPKGYYFNNTGLMACEPFYSKPSYRILSTCALYFPTTMVLMYCYGSSFHLSRFRLNDPTMPLTAAVHHPHLGHPPHMYQQALHAHHMQHGGMAGGGMSHHGLPPGTTTLPNTPVMNLSMAMSMGLGMGGMSGMTGMGGMGGMHYGGGGVGVGGGPGATASLMSGGNGGSAAGGAGAGAGAGGGGGPTNNVTKKIVPIQEKHSAGNTSRSMAAISLGFIVMITPWTIQEIVTACTGSKLPPFLDFVVTWIALSNSLWNPFMYWLLNSDFRRLSKHLMPNRCFPTEDTPEHKSPCCHINSDFEITTLPLPPEPPTGRPPKGGDAAGDNNGSEGGNSSSGGGGSSSRGGGGSGIRGGSVLGICARARTNSLSRSGSQQARKNANSGAGGCSNSSHGHHGHSHHGGGGGGGMTFTSVRPDIEGLSEKYWGEILERTVSSGSLHALTKSFPHAAPHHYYAAHHQPTHQQTFPPPPHTATMTTSFSKHSELNLNLALAEQERHAAALHDASGGGGGGGTGTLNAYELSKFSSSEPKLCEHIYHDANCAKNKSALGGGGGGVTSVSGADDVKMSAGSAAVASATGRSIPDI